MKRRIIIAWLFAAYSSVCCATVLASQQNVPQSSTLSAGMQNNINALIQHLNPKVNLGAVVVDLASGETLYQRNVDRLFIPASNMKLFSEAAVLMILGPDYRFKNQLSTSANRLEQGVLYGDLYLHLNGDPSFSRDDLRMIFSSLRDWNIQTIQGNLYIDSSLANVNAYPPGWLASDLSYSYGAPIAPLMLDANRLMVTVSPAATVGVPAVVEADDAGSGIVINNQTTTKANATGCGVGFSLDKDNALVARGCVAVGQAAVQMRMAIKNPLKYAQGVIRSELQQEHIQLNGQVLLGKAPSGSLLLTTRQSKPLLQLMADTLKPSDNLYADSLYLHAASAVNGAPLNWDGAQEIIKHFLQEQTGIDLSKAVFTDGSGLSRYNLVTPQQAISLLTFLYQRFPVAYEYIASLPIAGRDGTLAKRFKTPQQQGFVRAKTGTMTGMNSLSGYLYTSNGHTLAFALFINRIPGSSAGPGRPVLDALCAFLLQSTPKTEHVAQVTTAHSRIQLLSHLTQADKQKRDQAQWRRIEAGVRTALKGQAVTVTYRGHELVIDDKQADARKVWSALQSIATRYSFAVALSSKDLAVNRSDKPLMLWINNPKLSDQRTWIIKESL